jgi:hypothetical protein
MSVVEISLVVFGLCAFVLSFVIGGKSKGQDEQHIDMELIRSVMDNEVKDAKTRISEVVDETIEYAVEKAERASERLSNEKIMEISEYSDTVLSDINKSHQEVMFLYDMLNNKHENLKETARQVGITAKEAEEAANAAVLAIAGSSNENTEPELKPIVARKVEATGSENIIGNTAPINPDELKSLSVEELSGLIHGDMPEEVDEVAPENDKDENGENLENKNDRILELHKKGISDVDIAKELGLGVGEVKLVINLFKGDV